MATLYECDDAARRKLDNYTGAATDVDLDGAIVALFVLPSTAVSHSTALSAITEATFPGYSRITLSGPWPASAVTAHVASTTWGSTLTWTCTGGSPQTVYGLYVLDPSGTYLLYVANFDGGPYTMQNNGDQIKVTLTETQQSES